MPIPALKSMAKKTGKSVKTLERYWDDAKKSAKKQSPKDKYAYIMGIVQKRAGIESIQFKNKELTEILTKEYILDIGDK